MELKVILSILVLFSIAFLVPSDAFGAWYDTEWEYRNKITVSLNSVISNDLTDFPVLIKFTHDDLKQANENMGRDFVFTESDGITKLSHEIISTIVQSDSSLVNKLVETSIVFLIVANTL